MTDLERQLRDRVKLLKTARSLPDHERNEKATKEYIVNAWFKAGIADKQGKLKELVKSD